MSAVASSSVAVVGRNSNTYLIGSVSSSSKRPNGAFQALTDDYSQFTLGGEFDDFDEVIPSNFECSTLTLDSRPEETLINHSDDCLDKKRNKNSSKESSVSHCVRKFSKLTDEIEVDGDSVSDELDLLPPLPPLSSGRTFPKWKMKLPKWLLCGNPRIPMKCNIM